MDDAVRGAIGIAAREGFHRVVYVRLDDLARDPANVRSEVCVHQGLVDGLSTIGLLIINDLSIDPDTGNHLFAIVSNRNESLATIVCLADRALPLGRRSARPSRS